MYIDKRTVLRTENQGTWHKKGDVRKVERVSTEYCCQEMMEAFEDNYIGFGEYEGESKDADVNIYHCSPYPEGAVWGEMAIKFCPFCAQEIQISEVQDA